jgi:hypothetical protein
MDDWTDHVQVFITLRDERRQRAQQLMQKRKAELNSF